MNDRNPHDPCLRVEAATFMIGSTTLLHDIDFHGSRWRARGLGRPEWGG